MSESKLEAELVVETKAARKAAAHSIKRKCTLLRCPVPVLERWVVVWHESWLGYDRVARITRKKVQFERDGKVMKCCLQDPDGYDLMSRDQCAREIPELVAAVDC
jgi:hypothetical protein